MVRLSSIVSLSFLSLLHSCLSCLLQFYALPLPLNSLSLSFLSLFLPLFKNSSFVSFLAQFTTRSFSCPFLIRKGKKRRQKRDEEPLRIVTRFLSLKDGERERKRYKKEEREREMQERRERERCYFSSLDWRERKLNQGGCNRWKYFHGMKKFDTLIEISDTKSRREKKNSLSQRKRERKRMLPPGRM